MRVFIALSMIFCFCQANADVIQLKDNSKIYGNFVRKDQYNLFFKTSFAGVVKFPAKSVVLLTVGEEIQSTDKPIKTTQAVVKETSLLQYRLALNIAGFTGKKNSDTYNGSLGIRYVDEYERRMNLNVGAEYGLRNRRENRNKQRVLGIIPPTMKAGWRFLLIPNVSGCLKLAFVVSTSAIPLNVTIATTQVILSAFPWAGFKPHPPRFLK